MSRETARPGQAPAPHELAILRVYLDVGSIKEAAAVTGKSPHTVRNALVSLQTKLGVHRTSQVVHRLRPGTTDDLRARLALRVSARGLRRVAAEACVHHSVLSRYLHGAVPNGRTLDKLGAWLDREALS